MQVLSIKKNFDLIKFKIYTSENAFLINWWVEWILIVTGDAILKRLLGSKEKLS